MLDTNYFSFSKFLMESVTQAGKRQGFFSMSSSFLLILLRKSTSAGWPNPGDFPENSALGA